MGLGVGDRERAAPAPAEYDPALDPERLAQALDVRHEIPGRVLAQLGVRRALAAAALVEEHDAPLPRVEVAPVDRIDAAARTAVQEDERLSARVAALLVVQRVQPRHAQLAAGVRFDLGEELAWARAVGLASHGARP